MWIPTLNRKKRVMEKTFIEKMGGDKLTPGQSEELKREKGVAETMELKCVVP